MKIDWQDLVRKTLFEPKVAAGELMEMRRGLSHEALWTGVMLVAILNAIVVSLGFQLFPPTEEQMQQLPRVFSRPALLAVFVAGAFALAIFVLFWAGKALGGKAELWDVLVVFTWLELCQVIAQALFLAIALVMPPVADLLSFAAGIWGLWILISFLDRVHDFNNPLRAIGVLAVSFGLLITGVFFLVLLITTGAEGGL